MKFLNLILSVDGVIDYTCITVTLKFLNNNQRRLYAKKIKGITVTLKFLNTVCCAVFPPSSAVEY